MFSKLDSPNFNLFNNPLVMLSCKEGFAFISFGKLVNVSKHAVRVAWVFKGNKQIRNICLTKCWTVFFFVLFYSLILLLRLNWAFNWLATFSIRNWEQECVLSLTVHKVTNPTGWVETSENMSLVCLHEDKSWTHVVTLCMESLSTTAVHNSLSLYFLWMLIQQSGTS